MSSQYVDYICSSAVFGKNSQSVEAIGSFRGRAPSWMFDRILNAAQPNNLLQLEEVLRRSFPALGLDEEISDTPCRLIHQTQQDKILD